MWIHIKTAPNAVMADAWRELLENEGIPCQVKPDPAEKHLGDLAHQRIYVPKDRVQVAEELLRTV